MSINFKPQRIVRIRSIELEALKQRLEQELLQQEMEALLKRLKQEFKNENKMKNTRARK